MSAESQRQRPTDDDQQLEHVSILGWRGRQNQLGRVLARVRTGVSDDTGSPDFRPVECANTYAQSGRRLAYSVWSVVSTVKEFEARAPS